MKPWEEPHIRQPVSAPHLKLKCLWATGCCSLNRVLSHPASAPCVPVKDCNYTLECVTLSPASYMGGGKVCVWERERETESSPSSPLPHDSSLESVCLCMHVCHSLALGGREAFSRGWLVVVVGWGGGLNWLSHSYVRIRQIHLHFLTATHSISRHTCVMFWRPGHSTEDMRSFQCWRFCFPFSKCHSLHFRSVPVHTVTPRTAHTHRHLWETASFDT